MGDSVVSYRMVIHVNDNVVRVVVLDPTIPGAELIASSHAYL